MMLEVMVHRFESIHQEKSGSWMDVDQKAEKQSLGTLSENWPEDEVMGRSSAGWGAHRSSSTTEHLRGAGPVPQDKKHVLQQPWSPLRVAPDATASLQALSFWGQQTCPCPAFSVSHPP